MLRSLICKTTSTSVRATPRAMLAASSIRSSVFKAGPLALSSTASSLVPSSSALVRMLATRAGAAGPPAVKKTAPPPEPTIADTKAGLAALAANELKNLEAPAADHPYAGYIKEHGITVDWDFKSDIITVKKSKNGYDIRVLFNTTSSLDEDGMNEDEEGEKEENEENQDDNEDDDRPQQFPLMVHVSKAGKTPLRVHGLVGKDGKLYFEGFTVGDDDYKEVKELSEEFSLPYRIEYNDMSTELQDKLADFMDHLRIDDEFAQFVPAVINEQMRGAMHRNLAKLIDFAKDH